MARRPKGSGGLRHLSGDRWQITVYVGGKRLTRVFTARNGTEANRAADAVRMALIVDRERMAGTGDAEREERQRWTVEQYARYYLREWAPRKLQATTCERYRQAIENQIVPYLGTKLMSEVTVMDIVKWQDGLAAEGQRRYGGRLSNGTITKVHNVLGAIFSFAVDVQEDFPKNPVHSTNAKPKAKLDDQTREDSPTVRALDVAAVSRFVELAREEEAPEVFAGVLLSARLGLRRGEALAVQWQDVDFDARRVSIRRAISQAPAGERVEGQKRATIVDAKPTKTEKVRHIPIGEQMVGELRAIQKRQATVRLGQAYITATADGSPLKPEDYTSRFRALAKRHKLVVTPHVLRHSWCSQMISLGYDAVTIASMSGHSPDVLLKVYGHAFEKRRREAVDAYDDAWIVASGAR